MNVIISLYTLADPRTGEVRYVGWTSKTAKERLKSHLYEARYSGGTRKLHWLRSILADSLRPIIRTVAILESTKEAKRCKIALIANFRARNYRLVNGTDGGDGVSPAAGAAVAGANRRRMWSAEARGRISAFMSRIPRNAEWCARIGESNRRRGARSPETRAKIAAGHRGIILSAEHRAKLSAAWKGRKRPPFTAEHCANISKAQRGKTLTAEHRAKISEGLRNSPYRAAAHAKTTAANLGKKRSPQTRAKMSEARRAYFARERLVIATPLGVRP